jgi:GT2 family glycosyltransferase
MRCQSENYKLIICIAAHNVCDLLRECLKSVFASTVTFTYHVVVNDDGSHDQSSQMVAAEFPQVHLMRNEKALGFVRTNNQMLQTHDGTGEYYLLLNDDTVVQPNALQELVDFADLHSECGIVGGKLIKPNGTLDWPCKRSFLTPAMFFYRAFGLDKLFPDSRTFGRHHLTYLSADETYEVDAVCGALMMIRSRTLAQIGLLDEDIHMYGEDVAWCFQAKERGWKVYYHPKAVVLHYKSGSAKKRSYYLTYIWYRSGWIIYKKSVGRRYNPLVNAIIFLGMHSMLCASLIANCLRREKGLPSRT